MIAQPKSVKKFPLPILFLLLFVLGCGADPLARGSLSLMQHPQPLGYSSANDPLLIGDFSGKPLLLYVKSTWCPICKDLDEMLENSNFIDREETMVSLVILELIDGKILDKSGTKNIPFTPEDGGGIHNVSRKTHEPFYFVGDSETGLNILKLKRLPALIGFDPGGRVAGILYGSQTGMEDKIRNLIIEIKAHTLEETKEDIGF